MEAREVMRRLEELGTAQNRKVYARHGVQGECFGVSYANLGKLRKSIGTDHDLARTLWSTGNHDARVLATMVADPGLTTRKELESWARDLGNYVLTDAFVGLASRCADAPKLFRKWTASAGEWTGSAGWSLLAVMLRDDAPLDDDFLEECIEEIEGRIRSARNRVRYSMNGALIAIGCRAGKLERKAVAAARRIGEVEVDHGETGCRTPEVEATIAKVRARRRERGKRAAVRKKA